MNVSRKLRRAGFTLMEVLLVLVILVVLGTLGVVGYTRVLAGAKKDAATRLVAEVGHAIELYQLRMDKLPDSEEGLTALTTRPDDEKLAEKWDLGGPFLKDGKIPNDPWGNPIRYELLPDTGTTTGPKFHVWSTGPNGQDGDDDDIRSWSEEGAGT